MWRGLLAALAFASQAPQGQRPVIGVDIQPTTVAVGEPFTVRIRVRGPAGTVIRYPAAPDSADAVEALDPRAIDDRSTNEGFDQTARYRFIAWEPGRRAVPLGSVQWERPRGLVPLAMAPVFIEVTTLLPQDSALLVPRQARAPLDPPPQWWRWGLIAASVLAIAWMARLAWRRRQHGPRPPDAFADAQADFDAVDAQDFVEAGEPGRAVLAYADVMRAYLTRRFPQAMDGLTTADFVQTLAAHELPILPETVEEVLAASDAIKFANAPVDAARVAEIARAARGVVRDVQVAYEARLAAAEKGKGPRGRRRREA